MTNWNDPTEMALEAQVFSRLVFAFFGLYLWELVETCHFEWSFITGRRRFRWHLVFFVMCRLCLLGSFIGLIISMSLKNPVNCEALYTFNAVVGNLSILAATTSLMLRAIVIWERNLVVLVSLGVLATIHWAILWYAMFLVHASWQSVDTMCAVTSTNSFFLPAVFYYTMAFDLAIFCVAAAGICRHAKRFGVHELLFDEGLIFFLKTGLCNVLPAVFATLRLNPVMDVVTAAPAATISAIAAGRSVTQLPEIESDLFIRTSPVVGENTTVQCIRTTQRPRRDMLGQVSVHSEQIIMEDLDRLDHSSTFKIDEDL